MKYRKHNAGQTSSIVGQKAQKKELRSQVLRSVMALGVAVTSWMGMTEALEAGNITRVDDTNKNLMQNGKADIFAESASGSVGLNKFKDFNVDSNELANLYFKQENSNQTLDTLVNTVENRIDIQGTVQAIRDNKIGGNLYFLSPKGMVIGAGGVINAGSLTAITMNQNDLPSDASAAEKAIKEGTLKASSSLDGSIVVNGQINTMTGIDLQAAAIYVQKANEGANAPSLRTGVVFKNTVNTDGIYEVDDSQKLTASISDGKLVFKENNDPNGLQGDGSIQLTASANEKNAIDPDSTLGSWLKKNTLAKADVVVGEGATIAAAGDVSITSDAQVSMKSIPENIESTKKDGKTEEGDHWYNYIGTAKANTEVNGTVSGANVTISSKASSELEADQYHNFLEVVVNDAKDEVPDFLKKIGGKIADAAIKKMSKSNDTSDKKDDATTDKDKEQQESQASSALTGILNQAFVTYGSTEATANTTIGSNAKITADGDLAVTATSNAANTAKLTVRPEVEKDKTSYAEAFTGGLIYEDNVSHATVNVDGTLTSTGKTDIEANATSKVAASMGLRNSVYASDKDSTNDKKDPTTVPSLATIAVGVNSQDSKAEVNIGKKNDKATVTAGKDLNVNATTTNEMTSAVMALNNDNTTLSTTVNVATSNGNATVNNAGKLTSNDGNVTIQAAEKLNKLDVITGNAFSDNLYEGAEAVFNSKVYEEPISKKFSPLAQLLYAQNQYAPGKNVSISGDTWKNYFDVGAAISVSNVTNTAQVNLDESSRIQSKGNTTIDAGVTIGDVRNITSHVLQISNKDTDYGVSAAVGVSNMTNTAEVNVKSDNASEDAINAKGKVTIHANTTQEYKRFENMVSALDKAWTDFKDNWTSIPGSKDELQSKFNTLKSLLENVKALKPKSFDISQLNKQDIQNAAQNLYNIAYKLDTKKTLLPALEAFMDASNYANMYVASSAGKVESKGDATAMASGSVGVQNLYNNAHVNIGPNTNIKAGGDAKITADVNETNVMVAGRLILTSIPADVGSPQNTSVGLGGTVGVQNAYTDSLVKVANDVTIDANAIQLATNNDVLNIGAAVGGAKTSKLGITGMVNYLGGTSHANTLIDDDVNLTAKKDLNLTALNDTNVISVVGDFMSGQNSSIGVSTGVISYDVETKAKVANLETNKDGTSSESKENKKNKGTISASTVKVGATTEGTINNLTVAGVTSGSKKESGSGSGGESGDKDDKEKTDNKNGDAGGVDVKDDGGNSIISDTESGESGSSDITIGGDTDEPAPSVSDDEPPAPPASGTVDIDKPTIDKPTTQAVRNGAAEGEGEAPVPGQGESGGSGDSGDNKGEGSGEAGKDDGGDPAPGAGESGGSDSSKDKTTAIRINAAGSVSWNYVKDDTEAGLDNVNIKLTGQNSSLSVESQDNSYIGAYSGAMALTKMGVSNDKDSDGNRKFDASLSGAIAKNDLHKVTWASLGNTTVTTEDGAAADILNYAHNSGAQVAAGVSLGIETGKRGSGASVNLGASGSANYVDSQVHADMTENTLSGKNTTISNIAYDQDIQVAGGVTAQYANSNASVGAAASINKVKNDIQAAMKNNNIGTSTSSVQNVKNIAGSHLTQVGSAISVGVSRGNTSYAVGNVAVSNNSITNTVNATVDGDTILAGKVSVEATDGKISVNNTEVDDNAHVNDLNTKNADGTINTIFDLTGEDAMANANGNGGSDMDASVTESDKDSANYEHKDIEVSNKGNTIVGTALGLGVKTGSSDKASAAGAAAAVVNSVKNNFTASVKGATISTGTSGTNDAAMKVAASSDTKMIGVAAGVAAAVKGGEKASFAVAGSGVRQSIQNETTAAVEDTTVNTDHLKISGETNSTLVSVAGQVSAETGKSGVAAGLTWANNKLKNTTGAYAKGLTLSGISGGDTNLDVTGTNNSSAWAVAAGASVSLGNGAVEGAGAINEGTNNTEAIVDMSDSKKKTTITNAKSIYVNATDKASAKAIAGTVAVAVSEGDKPSATIGGSISYNNIGNNATDKQHVTAKLNNATITTTNEADIQVVADNETHFLNLALGGAVRTGSSSGGAAQGSVAITTLYTDTLASMEGTNIDTEENDKKNAKVSVNANSESHITNSADGIAASVSTGEGISLAGSGAVSTIKSDADTKANITGGELRLKNLIAQAKSDNQIINISMGLSAAIGTAGGSGALAGNVATNTIANDTAVSISGATVVADGTVSALAKSNEQISNYGGAVSVGATAGSTGVALGATIVTNTITGNTTSNVNESNITALGNDAGVSITDHTVNETTEDEKTLHSVENTATTKKGFVVNADANHAVNDISITAGVGASSATGVAADATVVINTIGGKTGATVSNTNINKEAADFSKADVSITAYDKADINSHLGTLAVGAAGTAGVGAAGAGDRNTVSRETVAEITSTDTNKNTLNAHDASVKALGETKIHVSESGVAAGASGTGAAAVIGSVSDDHFTSQTKALISGMKGTVHDLDVTAHRLADVKTYNNSFALSGGIVSGSVGVGVTNIYDASITNAEVANSTLDTDSDETKRQVKVDAHNYTDLKTELSDNALSVSAGGAVGVSVANVIVESQVGATISDSKLGREKSFSDVSVTANNDISNNYTNVVDATGPLIGGAVGKGSVNVNTATSATVSDSEIHARNITVGAEEVKDLKAKMVGVGIGAGNVGVNVMYTNVGTTLKDGYQYSEGTNDSYDTVDIQNYVNEALHRMNSQAEEAQSYDSSIKNGADTINKGTIHEGVQTIVSDSKLYAEGDMDIHASATTDTDVSIQQAGVAIANVAVAANRTDVQDKLGVSISKSTLEGKKLGINSTTAGTLKSYTGQGSFSGATYADTTSYMKHGGENLIAIDSSVLKASKVTEAEPALTIAAANNVKFDHSATSVNISGASAGRLIVDSIDESNVAIALGAKKDGEGDNTLTADSISVTAENAPEVKSDTTGTNVAGMVGKGVITIASANGSAYVNVTDKNHFDTYNEATKTSGKVDLFALTKADIQAIGQAVGVSGTDVTVNKVRTYNTMTAGMALGAATFGHQAKDDKGNSYTVDGSLADLAVGASNDSKAEARVKSTSVAGAAITTNYAQNYTNTTVNTKIDAKNGGLHVKSLDAYATNSDTVTATTVGTSAALVSIAPGLAKVENTVKGSTKISVAGNIMAQENAKIRAERNDVYNLKADGLTATAAGGAGAKVSSDVTNETEVNLDAATLSTESDLLIDSENHTTMNRADGFDKMVVATGYGALDVDTAHIDNTINSKAHVNLKDSSLDSKGEMKLISENKEDLQVNGYVYNVSSTGGAETTVNNTITNDGDITLTNSHLKTQKVSKDITISSADDLKLYAHADAETATGLLTGANSIMTNTLTRKNQIHLTHGSTLFSAQDINLYAGKHADGSLGLLDLNAVAADFIGGVIPVAIMPSVTNKMNQANQISIDTTSASRSVRHSNFYASAGREMSNVYAKRYVGIYGNSEKGSFVSSENGTVDLKGKTANNSVTIDGTAVAGIANRINIVIGDPGDKVVLDNDLRNTVVGGAKGKDDINVSVTADASTGLTKDSLIFGSEDYANTLYKRYQEVYALMLEYSKDGLNSQAYLGYQEEASRIENEMLRMGVADQVTGEDGKVRIVPKASFLVDYVEIPELNSSGGNITVDTDDFQGNGTVKAQGNEGVTITNNTNLMTKVNDITVGDAGGNLIYNGQTLTGKKGEINQKINDINKKSKAASFKEVTEGEGKAGIISIAGNYNGNDISFNIPDIANGITMNPKADILIQGNLYAKDGKIKVSSASNNILIQGKVVKDAVSINAQDIVLEAAKGSITQSYTDGIVNIGGSVKDHYEDITSGKLEKKNPQANEELKEGDEAKGSYIAGDTVYINAADINVNGTIQSGFQDYYATISDAEKERIDQIQQNYDGRDLSDVAVTTGDQYRIIKGGAVWDATNKCYKYKLNVYYNPSTKKILVENVDAKGGQIYLTGRISSTGNGQIICLDGVSDINVANATDYDLKVGRLTTNDVNGLVSIKDIARNTLTMIANGETSVTTLNPLTGKRDDNSAPNGVLLSKGTDAKGNHSYTYNPKTGLTYTWTEGKESTTYTKYETTHTTGGWSMEWSSSDAVNKLAQWVQDKKTTGETKNIGNGTSKEQDRKSGETIRDTGNSISNNSVKTSNTTLSNKTTIDGVSSTSHGLWGYYKDNTVTWTESTGTVSTYEASVKADNPIDIKFIGKKAEDGKISVSSTGTGNIEMTGNIGNTKLYETKSGDTTNYAEKGTIAIKSDGGSLIQSGGSLYGANINLAARKDMQDIQITAGDTVNISAVNPTKNANDVEQNSINLTIKSAGLAKGNAVLGLVGAATTKDDGTYKFVSGGTGITGKVNIKTTGREGNISQREGAVIVSDRIDLTSENGSIYGQKKEGKYTNLNVYTGQQPIGLDTLDASLNATAKGDICLSQTEGDMRIGHIISKEGDVNLNIEKGSVIDALPYTQDDRGDADDLVERWKSMGLIDGGDQDVLAAKKKLSEGYQAWDENALLYAIQDSIVNPDSSTVKKDFSDKDPNVVGKNITITVADSVGIKDGTTTVINTDTLLEKDHLGDLKKLSRVDASSDVKWSTDEKGNHIATITEKLPIGIQQTSKEGKITIKSMVKADDAALGGNISIEGRVDKETTSDVNKDLSIGAIETKKGDVSISSLGNITQVDKDVISIVGKSLNITAGGSIGTDEQHIITNLFGDNKKEDGLSAVSSSGIYIDQKKAEGSDGNNLIIRNISSGGDIYLGSDKSILMGEVEGTNAVNYIRAENDGSITLEARGGSIGEAETDTTDNKNRKSNKGVRILNSGSENKSNVTLNAKDNAYVTGIASADGKTPTIAGKSGSLDLTVGSVEKNGTLQNVGISVDGTLNLAGDIKTNNTASIYTTTDLRVDKSVSSNDTYVGSVESVTVTGDDTKLEGSSQLTIKADGGDIVHNGGTILATKEALLHAGRNVLLQSGILKADANVTLNANGYIAETYDNDTSTGYQLMDAGTLSVSAGRGIDLGSKTNKLATVKLDVADGDVILGNGGDNTLDVSFKDGTTVNGRIDIHNYESEKANEMKIHGSIKVTGDITFTNDEHAEDDQSTDIIIGKDILSDEKQDVIEGNNIIITSKGRILNNDQITANKNVQMTSSEASVVNPGSIVAKDGNITLTAKDIIGNDGGDIEAKNGTINMDAGEEIDNHTGIKATNGDVILKAGYSITNKNDEKGTGVIEATGKISMTTSGVSNSEMDDNSILNESEIRAGGDVTMDAAADLFNTGSLASTSGNVTLKGAQKADDAHDIVGHVSNIGTIDAKGDILLSTKNGYVNNQKQITSAEGSVTLEAKKAKSHTKEEVIGDIYNVGESGSTQETAIKAKNGIRISADYDFINFGDYEVTGEGAIDITTKRHFINSGAMATTKGDVTITSIDGGIFNYETGDIVTKDGNVTLHTQSKDADMWYLDETGKWLKVTDLKNVTTDENGDKYYKIGDKQHWVSEDGSISNAGDIAANGKITLKADHGNVTNYDDFSEPGNGKAEATSDIELSAVNGMLYNKHDLEAGENITLVAKAGLQNFSYNIYAGKNITLHATDGDIDNTSVLESVAGDVMLKVDNGSITNGKLDENAQVIKGSGDIITLGGNVILDAKNDVNNYGDLAAIDANAANKDTAGSIILKSAEGNVTNYDDFNRIGGDSESDETYRYNASKHLSYTGVTDGTSYNVATNNITISAEHGTINNAKKYLVAKKNVDLTAKTGLGSAGDVILAGKNISMTVKEGSLINEANLVSVDGNVSLTADDGSVINMNTGKLVALNGNVSLHANGAAEAGSEIRMAEKGGDAGEKLVLDVPQEKLEAAKGHILVTRHYYMDAGEKKYLTSEQPNAPKNATVFTEVSYMDTIGLVLLKDGLKGQFEAFRAGDVVNRGDIVALNTAGQKPDGTKDITSEATTAEKGNVILKSTNGNVTNYDDFNTVNDGQEKAGTIYKFLGGTGYITGADAAKAKFNEDTGYTKDQNYILGDTSITIDASNGYLYNDFDMKSHGDITLISGKDLTIGGAAGNVKSIEADGNVIVRSSVGSVHNDSHIVSNNLNVILDGYAGVTSGDRESLKAENGSISAVSEAGEINMKELVAGKMAVAGTGKDGTNNNITIKTIEGEDVLLYTENEKSTISVYENGIKVKDHLFLQGNEFNISKIDHTGDNVGTLFVDVNGIDKDGSSSAVKGCLKLDIDGDVRFTTLNVTDAKVKVGGKLGIDKLHVGGEAHFDSMGYVTGVFGKASNHDGSHALYFDNGNGQGGRGMTLHAREFSADPDKNLPVMNTLAGLRGRLEKAEGGSGTFGKDNGGWMNLYIDGSHDQRSNGLLLHIDTYFHSLNQRWSAEDLSGKLLDFKPYMGYMAHYDVPMTVYDRYNVIENEE